MSEHHGVGHLGETSKYCRYGHRQNSGDRFGRLFELPGLYIDVNSLKELGKKTGPMDGGTTSNRTTTVDVGQVFFGQFVDHDITLDVSSSLGGVFAADEISNSRTPTLDLDNIYGAGPEASPYLYHGTGAYTGVKLLTGADGTAASQDPAFAKEDLTRTVHGTAIIGDPRNDENRIVSQLQLAMIRFHNKAVDSVKASEPSLEGKKLFEATRELVTRHYHWVILNDFLVTMCGKAVVADILGNGRQFYCYDDESPFIPVEFSVAAYRFGHSMVPQKIQVQQGANAFELFGNKLGRGFSPLADADAVVDWNELVEAAPGHVVQKAEKLDSKMATDLLDLPFIKAPAESSLATRNLLRGQAFMLPSGESVADEMGRDAAEIATVSQAAASKAGAAVDLSSGTPLWYYLLVEAETIGRETTAGNFDKSEGLGPVGARIVAETLVGLMELDERSFLASNRSWHPDEGLGVTTLGEMLTF